ncbi:hypothetical protein V1525DRAFT_384346 [Lipomyces kononenkoae]|uniref:Uncharacterized protein n=1 Tax=Lipomyces kononenkoae TaxID=34357 RepID=A0ACC3SQE7_LIPKO
MDAIVGEHNPQSASGSRASRSVAPIVAPSVRDGPQQAPDRKSEGRVTKHTVKRRAVVEGPARGLRRPVSDQAAEQGKRVKLSIEPELSALPNTIAVMDSQVLSNYNKAFTLLKDNPLEQRLDVQLPFEKFLQLDHAFSELKSAEGISEDQRYPSLGYNSHTETVTVVTAPSSIHESSTRWIEHEIFEYARQYLSTRSPHTLQRIRQVGSTTKGFSLGDYTRSRKEPDAGFSYMAVGGEGEVMIALESGHTEAYGRLLDDKDMWINGMGINVVILVCFRERPRFANPPTTPYQDVKNWRNELKTMSHTIGEADELNIQRGFYGPLRYRGHTWAGELNEAFIEVWRPDSHDRFCFIQSGFAVGVEDLPVTLGLRVSDLYPRDTWEAADLEDAVIPFDSSAFLEGLRIDVVQAAQDRFRLFLFEKLGL